MRITSVKATPVNLPFHAAYRFAFGSTASLTKTIVEVETDEGLIGLGEAATATPRHRSHGSASGSSASTRSTSTSASGGASRQSAPAVGERDDAAARVRRDRDGALGPSRPRRNLPLTTCSAAPFDTKSHSPSTSRCGFLALVAGRSDAARSRAVLRSDDRRARRAGFEGKLVPNRRHRGGDGARGASRDRRPAPATRREWRLDLPDGARCCGASSATTSAVSRTLSTRTRSSRACGRSRTAFSAHAPDLRRAVALGVPDFYVLNIVELGGIRRTVEFVRACEMFGIGFWFHSGDTGVASAAYLHLSAALEPIREPSQALFHWYADDVIAEGPFSPRGGLLRVPDGPGLGVTLDAAALARCHERFLSEGAFPSASPGRTTPASSPEDIERLRPASPRRAAPLITLGYAGRKHPGLPPDPAVSSGPVRHIEWIGDRVRLAHHRRHLG